MNTPFAAPADDIGSAHRGYFAAVAACSGALALGCLVWPALVPLPWPLPPLHARCLGVLYATLSLLLLRCCAADDLAVVRVPLACTAAAGAGLAGAMLPAAPAWPAAHATAALGAWLLLQRDRTLKAPAEHAEPRLMTIAIAAGLVALTLLLWPAPAVPWWPWPLPSNTARLYAALLAALAVGAAMLARERRRAGRRLGLQALIGLALGLLAASGWHHALFDAAAASTWVWAGAWALTAASAAWRLRC